MPRSGLDAPPAARTLLALGACAVAAAAGAAPASASTRPGTVADTQPAWATPANLTQPAAGGDRMVFSVWLGWRDTAGLDRTLAGLYDPAGPGHRRWLSPERSTPATRPRPRRWTRCDRG